MKVLPISRSRASASWLCCCLWLAICCQTRADEEAAATPSEAVAAAPTKEQEQKPEETPAAAEKPAKSIPQAENVDLKEVITAPLPQALPLVPVTEDVKETADAGTTPPDDVSPSVEEEGKPLVLLGTEIPPSTATRIAWSAKDFLAGISVPTPVLVVNGAKAGPVLCLTGAVHGDELNGIEVVRQVLYDLQPEELSGSVIGVPIVNLQGFRRGSRYLPDRRDLNRYFPGRESGSAASRIAHSFFHDVVRHCNYLIDLHTGSFRRTNLPQLRADLTHPKVEEMTHKMGPIVVLQSRGARGSLRREAVERGIYSVTVEAGGPLRVDLKSVQLAVRSVETFMHGMGMYKQKGLWPRKTEPVYYKSRWVRAGSGGILLSDIQLGQRVKEGQTLGVVTDPITNVATPILAPFAGQVIGMALNQVMLPGYAAYHLGFQATVEEASQQDVGPDDSTGDDAEQEDSQLGPLEPE